MVKMNILVVSNNKYIKYLYVLMESLYRNHEGIQIRLYLVTSDIEESVKEKLIQWVEQNNQYISVCLVNPEEYRKFKITTSNWPIDVYYRLFPHKYLPEEEDRVLYLDVDIVVNSDIREFYNTDMKNHSMVVCGHDEAFQGIKFPNELTDKSAAEKTMFNSGVILFNLEYFRKNVGDTYYDSILDKGYHISFPDQGILNYYFYRSAMYANTMIYNFRWHTYIGRKNHIGEIAPKIIHYTCKNQPYKPWDLWFDEQEIKEYSQNEFIEGDFCVNSELNALIGVWWKYAISTPVYETLHNEMLVKKEWMKRFGIIKSFNDKNHEIIRFRKMLNDARETVDSLYECLRI